MSNPKSKIQNPKSEDLYRLLFDTALDAVVVIDEHSVIIDWNSQAETVFGWMRSEVIGRILSETIIPVQYRQAHQRGLKRFLATGKGSVSNKRVEITALHQSGHEFPVELSISALPQGETWIFSAFIRDITRRNQAEEQLRQLSQAVEQSASSVLITDVGGRIEYANPRFTHLTGYTLEEIIGKDPSILKSGETPSEEYKELWHAISSGGEWVGEFHNKRKNGEFYWVSASISPIRNSEGVITHFLGIEEDITKRKQLEQQIQESLQRRVRQVQTSTEVAQQIAAAPALDELFRQVVNLVWERFGYYHVRIYTLEQDGLLIRAGMGRAGREKQQIDQQITLFTEQSLIARAARTGEPVLAPDVSQAPNWISDPVLPDTKAEISVPIKLGQVVLGVLDVQNDAVDGLSEEDQLLLLGLCGQIAVAIDNRRVEAERKLTEIELENRLRELSALQRLMSRESWQSFQSTQDQTARGYLFDQTTVRPITPADVENGNVPSEQLPQSVFDNNHLLTRPVNVHGEIIGKIGVYDDPDHPLTPEEQEILDSVAEQVAEALERARLLEQTQTALAETGNLYDAGRRLNEAGNLQEIVAAVAETVSAPGINRAALVTFDHDLAGEVEAMTVAANWHSGQGVLPPPIGTRYPRAVFASVEVFLSPRSIFLDDILDDERVGPATVEILQRQNIRALAVLPLWAGPHQLGALLFEAEEIHSFTEREIQPYTALAGQMAVAVENQRLLEQVQRQVAERAALNEVSLAILNQSDPLSIYQMAAQVLVDDFNMSFARVWVLDEVSNELVLRVSAGEYTHLDGPHSRVSLNSGRKLAWIANQREPHISNNLFDDPRLDNKEWARETNTIAFAGYPLFAGDDMIGVLGMFSHEPIAVETLSLLQSLSTLISTVVNTRRLFEQIQIALAEVEATQRRYTVQAWQTYRARDVTLSHEHVRAGVTPLGKTLPPEVSQAVARRQLLTTGSSLQLITGGQSSASDSKQSQAKSSLIAPLIVRGEVIGVLGLQEMDERDWSPEEIALVEAIAEQMAQAAENIRLIDESQQRAAREKRVNEIGEKIQAAQSLEEALQIAVKEVGQSLKAPQTTVQLDVE